ncbi:hypothetical protein F4801DRAFT_469611 [Xylaria longipes]|nr:hypothetical protein F4801DRAFT_469611 [Xylaria longipes]
MQQHIVFHLVRLALLALSPVGDGSRGDDESMQSSDSHQPQQFGRTESVVGDFGLKHGLQRIPCDALEVGRLFFANTSNEMLVFYDSERSTFSFCFNLIDQDRSRPLSETFFYRPKVLLAGCEYIIEYDMIDISALELSEQEDILTVKLRNPSIFYRRQLIVDYGIAFESRDFTKDEEFSRVLVHSLRRPPTVAWEDFKQLKDWLHDMFVSTSEKLVSEQDSAKWNATMQGLKRTKPNNDINQWILNVNLDSRPVENLGQVAPPDDVDDAMIKAE